MTRESTTVIRVLCTLACVVLVACGCNGESEEGPVESVLNGRVAASAAVGYLQRTVDALSWEATLDEQIPGISSSRRHATPVPCDDDDDNPEQPYQWSRAMWLLIPPGSTPQRVFGDVVTAWATLGWRSQDVFADRHSVITADGYGLIVRDNGRGDVSVAVTTPCFRKSVLDRNIDWPKTITKSPSQ